jgi:hypothetical protein
MEGLLGASKNLGVSSMVQSALRLHGQMMHVGTASGTVAAIALRDDLSPRGIATTPERVAEVQRILVRGAGGPGTLIWPWHDLSPEDRWFEAANLLTLAGIWKPDPDSVFFEPRRPVTRGELAGALVRLRRTMDGDPDKPALPDAARFSDLPLDHPEREAVETMLLWGNFGEQKETFIPGGHLSRGDLNRWLVAMGDPGFPTLLDKTEGGVLTRAECVEYLWRVWTR